MSEAAASDAVGFLARLPLFADLAEPEIEEFAWAATPFRCAAGEVLCRQGEDADEMFCIERGYLGIFVRVGGTEEERIGVLGAGAIVGESALVERAQRVASIVAIEPSTGYAVHRRAFEVLRAMRRPSALKVLRRLAAVISERLANSLPAGTGNLPGGPAPDLSAFRSAAAGLVAEDLRRLPALGEFAPAELDELLASSQQLVMPRRTVLFREGDPSGACYLTVRGAVELYVDRDGTRRKLALRGPGKLFGEAGLFSERPRAATAWTRERTMLLELDRAAFDRLFHEESAVAFGFLEAAMKLLVDLMRSAAVRGAWFEADRRGRQ